MSSTMLRQRALRTIKHSSRPDILASPRMSLSMNQYGATSPQTRLFYDTPARRLFESPDTIVAACLGVAGGVALTRFLIKSFPEKSAPDSHHTASARSHPFTWALTADQKTRDDVETIISAGFKMASKAPAGSRNRAFREASFRVPYEMPRLNREAPRFRVEDMSPMPPINKRWREMGEMGMRISAPFDPELEARVFLYFPNDATRATAAFLAINTEFRPVEHRSSQGKVTHNTTNEHHLRIFAAAASIWICQTISWRRHHPHILDRIEPGPLPVIMSFREWACVDIWDTNTENFLRPEEDRPLMKLTRITQ